MKLPFGCGSKWHAMCYMGVTSCASNFLNLWLPSGIGLVQHLRPKTNNDQLQHGAPDPYENIRLGETVVFRLGK